MGLSRQLVAALMLGLGFSHFGLASPTCAREEILELFAALAPQGVACPLVAKIKICPVLLVEAAEQCDGLVSM